MGVIFDRITFLSGTTSRARFPNKVGDGLEMLQLGVKRCLILAHCFFWFVCHQLLLTVLLLLLSKRIMLGMKLGRDVGSTPLLSWSTRVLERGGWRWAVTSILVRRASAAPVGLTQTKVRTYKLTGTTQGISVIPDYTICILLYHTRVLFIF